MDQPLKLQISHLSLGKSAFSFNSVTMNDISGEGFLVSSPINFNGNADKGADFIYVSAMADYTASMSCSRCVEEYAQQCSTEVKVLFTWQKKKAASESGDNWVLFIPPEQKHIDLTPFVREAILLDVPLKPICSENCRGLCSGCGINLNYQSCECKTTRTDARWDGLIRAMPSAN